MAVGVRESRYTQPAATRRIAYIFDAGKRNVVVLDDLMAETDGRVTDLFTKKSHHSNTSVIYLVQNLFSRNKESRTISLNTQYMVVFKNPRDASQITNLAKQMYPGRVKFIQEAFADATSTPYGYLLVDLKQDTPEDLRLRTSILPDDVVQYVYMLTCLVCLRRRTRSITNDRSPGWSVLRCCHGSTQGQLGVVDDLVSPAECWASSWAAP